MLIEGLLNPQPTTRNPQLIMATTTFTTWSALYAAMKNALADFIAKGKFTVAEYRIETDTNHRELKYRSLAEFKRDLEWVKTMADLETGAAVTRTYAKPVSRFPAG